MPRLAGQIAAARVFRLACLEGSHSMTAETTVPVTDGLPSPAISGELVDALIEAVVIPPHPRARSAVICGLVQEMFAAVGWRHDDDEGFDHAAEEEVASMRRLVRAAHDHYLSMTALASTYAADDARRG